MQGPCSASSRMAAGQGQKGLIVQRKAEGGAGKLKLIGQLAALPPLRQLQKRRVEPAAFGGLLTEGSIVKGDAETLGQLCSDLPAARCRTAG